MTSTIIKKIPHTNLSIQWEALSEDYVLPDEPVESNLQPLLASALRESLELGNLILESMLIASNFGLCATVRKQTIVKAPDWVYIPNVNPLTEGNIRRSYTPNLQGDKPTIVMEFISETEGGEYSINPHYPYGKWYFYEQILQVPVYVIFHPKTSELDVYRLHEGKYILQTANENGCYWLEEIDLFLGVWQGKKAEVFAYWLRFWDKEGNLLLWGGELLTIERQKVKETELLLKQEKISKQKLLDKLQEIGINLDDLNV